MTVVCIDTDLLSPGTLTLGKKYEIESSHYEGSSYRYIITNNYGDKGEYRADRFIALEEQRRIQLEKLGI